MNKHFAYLIESNEADFFQKVAIEQAESRRPVASTPFAKTAAPRALEGVTFEKVAARLDLDIHILKTAGACGMNLGMQKRAGAYIDQLLDQCELEPHEFDQIFEKVAGEAIAADLDAAFTFLSDGISPELVPWLDAELVKVGHALAHEAMLEKEAFGAALSASAKLFGRGAKAVIKAPYTIPRAIVRGGASVARKAGQGIRNMRIDSGVKSLAKTQASLAKREGMIADRAAKGDPGFFSRIKDGYDKDVATSLRAKATKTQKTIDDLTDKNLKKYSPAPPPKATAAPKASADVETPSSPKASPKAPDVDADSPAGKAATKTDAERAAATITPGSPGAADDLALGAAKGDGVTFKASYEKLRDGGWKSLSGAEKQKLINAGVATVVGGRIVLGKGIVTGGEGLI